MLLKHNGVNSVRKEHSLNITTFFEPNNYDLVYFSWPMLYCKKTMKIRKLPQNRFHSIVLSVCISTLLFLVWGNNPSEVPDMLSPTSKMHSMTKKWKPLNNWWNMKKLSCCFVGLFALVSKKCHCMFKWWLDPMIFFSRTHRKKTNMH